MRISFVLPLPGHEPMGGFKVTYEYANRLAARGHHVTVVHAPRAQRTRDPLKAAKRWAVYAGRRLDVAHLPAKLRGGWRPDAWFRMDSSVRLKWVPSLHARWMPDSDVVVATAWETAEWVNGYPQSKGRKFYLVQGDESMFRGADPERVANTWRLPLQKIVVSRWLQNLVAGVGESATYIPNGLDFDDIGVDVPPSERDPQRLLMLYHEQPLKGSRDGLEAMRLARQHIPRLRGALFGVPDKPKGLPTWISYQQQPVERLLRQLYNEASIFVAPSWAEGFPLPPAEAMQCGAALCATDIGGHREYAIHEQTALLSPPKNPESLASNIVRLVQDNHLRRRLAKQGHEYVQQFTWERALRALEPLFADTA